MEAVSNPCIVSRHRPPRCHVPDQKSANPPLDRRWSVVFLSWPWQVVTTLVRPSFLRYWVSAYFSNVLLFRRRIFKFKQGFHVGSTWWNTIIDRYSILSCLYHGDSGVLLWLELSGNRLSDKWETWYLVDFQYLNPGPCRLSIKLQTRSIGRVVV